MKFRNLILLVIVVGFVAFSASSMGTEMQVFHTEVELDESFIRAAIDLDYEQMLALWKAGIDVNAVSRKGHTPLMCACRAGFIDLVRAMIKDGADVNTISNTGYTALMVAAERGYVHVVKVLLDAGATIPDPVPSYRPDIKKILEKRRRVRK